MKTLIKLSILTISISFFLNLNNIKAQCHNDDLTALKALYESTDGDYWKYRDGWQEVIGSEPAANCNLEVLHGVNLDEQGRVDYLNLDNNQLRGTIPAELENLISLIGLFLSNNQLSGSIPVGLGNLNKLQYLLLDNNELSGNIPAELDNLSILSLSNNQLSGSIPPGLGNLSNLSWLGVNNNLLSGCYDKNLALLCDQLSAFSFEGNPNISDGNNFERPWEEFCAIGEGACKSCPLNLVIDNATPYQIPYQSGGSIITSGSVEILSGQQVEYRSNRVTLNRSFSAKSGADFKVRISGCDYDILPIISINTEGSLPIVSKEDYITGTIEISSENEDENLVTNLKIRGRGHSTWTFPKKPYQIKFDNKENVLGMPKDKKWILLANYSDKTMLRNEVAFDLGRFSNLDWTPESRFVELYINNEYLGIYQITQKVEETSNRVNIGNEGYLLEVDQLFRMDSDDVYFETTNYLFNIKEPNVELGDDEYVLIEDFIELTENVLLGSNFADPIEGYTKYIDVESFIEWYLINEITKNNDAIFYSSVYMNYIPGGKLKMGPIWDYDIGLGNIDYNGNETTDGFWIKKSIWFSRLFEDPNFVANVKSRFNYFYNNRHLFQEKINLNSLYLYEAQERNFNKWPILGIYVWPNNVFYPTYDEEIIYLKNWLDERFEWLKTSINEL